MLTLEEQKKRDAVEFKEQLQFATMKERQKEEYEKRMREENKNIILKQIQLERERKRNDREA